MKIQKFQLEILDVTANETLKKMSKEKEISEDDERRMQEAIQKITDDLLLKLIG